MSNKLQTIDREILACMDELKKIKTKGVRSGILYGPNQTDSSIQNSTESTDEPSLVSTVSADETNSGSYTVSINSNSVPVTVPSGSPEYTMGSIKAFGPFVKWQRGCTDAEYQVTGITIQQIDFVKDTCNVQFLKMQVEMDKTKAIIFMRGNSIAYGIMVTRRDTEEKYLVLLKRNRIPVTENQLLEIPACVETGERDCFEQPWGAINTVNSGLNKNLTSAHFRESEKLYPSPGGCDEAIQFKYAAIALSKNAIDSLLSNLSSSVVLVPLENVTQETTDMKSWIAAYHFMRHNDTSSRLLGL